MYKKRTEIKNDEGIHARPAAKFAALAAKFKSEINISVLRDENVIKSQPAKSIVSVMSLGLSKGTQIEIAAEGADEQEAVLALVASVESGYCDV